MKSAVCVAFAAVAVFLVTSATFSSNTVLPTIPSDFVVNYSTYVSGWPNTQTGYIMSDVAGRRYYKYTKQLNQSVYAFRSYTSSNLYTYTITNSGCSCTTEVGGEIPQPFLELQSALASPGGCANSTGGSFFVNAMFQGLPGVPSKSYCFNGNTPRYMTDADTTTVYSNFKPVRPTFLPAHPMADWIDICAGSCI